MTYSSTHETAFSLRKYELYTLPALQEKVCVKGGVTGEGIKALESGVQDMFHRVFQNTHMKYEEDISAQSERLFFKAQKSKTIVS